MQAVTDRFADLSVLVFAAATGIHKPCDALTGRHFDSRLEEAAARTSRGRLTSLQEVAWAAQFLASAASSGMSGHTLVVDVGSRVRGLG